nr:hypothetical protein [Candidatus Sigynarchaeum springense]MDO8116901.1 hypothetical protein [Candidatus Sigynarchaeota archaeon]
MFLQDGSHLIINADTVWDIEGDTCTELEGIDGEGLHLPNDLRISRDCEWVISIDKHSIDHKCTFWSAKTSKQQYSIPKMAKVLDWSSAGFFCCVDDDRNLWAIYPDKESNRMIPLSRKYSDEVSNSRVSPVEIEGRFYVLEERIIWCGAVSLDGKILVTLDLNGILAFWRLE